MWAEKISAKQGMALILILGGLTESQLSPATVHYYVLCFNAVLLGFQYLTSLERSKEFDLTRDSHSNYCAPPYVLS